MLDDPRWKLFQCQQCGRCCDETGLPYDSQSVHEIASFFNLTDEEVFEKYYGRFTEDRKFAILEDHKGRPCPFLNTKGDKKECAIYSVRPQGCRCYPFETVGGCLDVDCPGAKIVEAKLG